MERLRAFEQRMAALEERMEKLGSVEQLIDDERQARVVLEDTVQELEVAVHTVREETSLIQGALQDHADAIDAVNLTLYPQQQDQVSYRVRASTLFDRATVSAALMHDEEEGADNEEGYM